LDILYNTLVHLHGKNVKDNEKKRINLNLERIESVFGEISRHQEANISEQDPIKITVQDL
jgi:hypothetical protein